MIETYLNGVAAAKTWCGQRLKGVIGLQVHGVGADQTEPLKVQWRRIKIRDHGEHQWITILDSAQTPPQSTDGGSSLPLWKFTPDSATESLKLRLDLNEKQSWSCRQGDLSYKFNAAGNSFSFSFPPLTREQDSGPMGGLGSSQDRLWSQSRIFLHRNSWGVGYEILAPWIRKLQKSRPVRASPTRKRGKVDDHRLSRSPVASAGPDPKNSSK